MVEQFLLIYNLNFKIQSKYIKTLVSQKLIFSITEPVMMEGLYISQNKIKKVII